MLNILNPMINSQVQQNPSIKNEQKNNNSNINKVRTSITKKNPQTKKRTLKDLKSNKPLEFKLITK